VASLSQGRTAAAQCGLFTYKSVPVIFEPPCISDIPTGSSLCSSENIQANFGTILQVKTQSLPYTVLAIHYLPIIVILTMELHC